MDRVSTKFYDLEYGDDAVVLRLKGNLDCFDEAEALRAELERLMEEGTGSVVLDLTRTRRITGSGLAVIVLSKSRFAKRGGHLVLSGLDDDLREILRKLGLLPLLEVEASLEEALTACAAARVAGKAPTGTG